ncbi:putative Transmembrane exosortase EpsH [Flavobacterium sp. 9AF]|uniref:exosortase K n=1 Tax=Flavobacterium sp. 9AF TaxID=2653142 RepID=UPI0012F19C63|nr:putative Transmembrane exosortase EpsH [Flavobacterium sp. 9AF]
MKKNKTHIIILIFVFIFLKFLFSIANVDEIRFVLYPVSKTIDFITNTKSIYLINKGFFNSNLNFIINKSCSGINFFILFFICVSFRLSILKKQLPLYKNLFFSSVFSLCITYIANTSRILCSINLPSEITLDPKITHQIIGTGVYFFFLLFFYLLFDYSLKNKFIK